MARGRRELPDLKTALREFFSISWIATSVIGAPSVLILVRETMSSLTLSAVLERLVRLYERSVAQFATTLEPVIFAITDSLERILRIDIAISDYWMSIFIISMIYYTSNTRTLWADRHRVSAVVHAGVTTVFAFLTSVMAGMTLNDSSWWAQSFIAGQFGLLIFLGIAAAYSTFKLFNVFDPSYFRPPSSFLVLASGGAVLGAAGGALLYWLPLFQDRSGLATIFFGMIGYGVWWMAIGVRKVDVPVFTFTLRFLGGFIVAGLVVLFDVGFRAVV